MVVQSEIKKHFFTIFRGTRKTNKMGVVCEKYKEILTKKKQRCFEEIDL